MIDRTIPAASSPLAGAFANVVWALHTGLMIFLVCAWALPWSGALWAVVIVNPIVALNWWLFRNRCVLTMLEEWLRGEHWRRESHERSGEEEHSPPNFVSRFLSGLLGRPISVKCADRISYAVLYGGFSVAALRLWMRAGALA